MKKRGIVLEIEVFAYSELSGEAKKNVEIEANLLFGAKYWTNNDISKQYFQKHLFDVNGKTMMRVADKVDAPQKSLWLKLFYVLVKTAITVLPLLPIKYIEPINAGYIEPVYSTLGYMYSVIISIILVVSWAIVVEVSVDTAISWFDKRKVIKK